jgi:5-methylcytosine-specific restriction endonuclease McrA
MRLGAKMRKYTKELLENACKNSLSYAGVIRYLGMKQAGGTQCHIKKRVLEYGIDTSHFTGSVHNKGKQDPKRKTWQQILYLGQPTDARTKTPQLKRAMLDYGFIYECDECKIDATWRGKSLTLHIDHVNGIIWDNRPENVRFLCPNCHSQTETYCRPKRD